MVHPAPRERERHREGLLRAQSTTLLAKAKLPSRTASDWQSGPELLRTGLAFFSLLMPWTCKGLWLFFSRPLQTIKSFPCHWAGKQLSQTSPNKEESFPNLRHIEQEIASGTCPNVPTLSQTSPIASFQVKCLMLLVACKCPQ